MSRPWKAICTLVFPCLAGAAHPGAWPREAGDVFVSLSQEVTDRRGQANSTEAGFSSIYAEVGLPRRLTAGLDAGRSNHFDDWSVLLFLRRPLDDGTGANRFAVEVALGRGGGEEPGFRIRPGLSWGRGLTTRWGNGWAGLEGRYEWRTETDDGVWKADLTLGLSGDKGQMWIMQLQSGDYPDESPYLRLTPSYVRPLGQSRTKVQLGVIYDLSGHPTHGVKLGSWLSF